jgi:two-component system response regulator VicR
MSAPKRILVIDDDPDILEILHIIFEQEGYQVILSQTGDEADHIDEIQPDLVLLDLEILSSNKNGAVICARIKSQPETSNLPVILLSSRPEVGRICAECGADGYLRKPFEIAQLSKKVKQFLAA